MGLVPYSRHYITPCSFVLRHSLLTPFVWAPSGECACPLDCDLQRFLRTGKLKRKTSFAQRFELNWPLGYLNILPYSRMRSRRVPVLKLGSRGPGGDARSLRCAAKRSQSVRKVFASVRKRSRRDMPERRKSSRNVELSSLFTFRLTKVSTVTGIRGVVVAKPRTVVIFELVSGLHVLKVSTVTGIGGVVVAKPRTVVTFELVSGLRVSKVSTVTGIGGVVVAKSRTAVTFELVSGLRVSNVSAVTGIGGVLVAKSRIVVTFGLASGLRVSKVSAVTGIGGVVVAKSRTVVTFGLAAGERRKERGERRKER